MGPGSTLLRPGSSYKLSWRPQVPVKLRQGQVPVQILHPLDPLRKDSELWVPGTPPTSFASPALQADAEVVAAALASPFYAEPLLLRDSCCYLDRDTRRGPRTRVLAVITRLSAHCSLLRTHKPGSPLLPCLARTPVLLALVLTHCRLPKTRPL